MTHNSSNHTTADQTCNHPANDLIEAVAFGFASDSESQLMMAHLATCGICSEAFESARFAAQALPLSVEEMDVPDAVWANIAQRIEVPEQLLQSEPIGRSQVSRTASFHLHWGVAALLAVITLAAGILLGRTIFESGPEGDLVPVVEVSITDPEINATGSVRYVAEQGVIVLDLENLPPASEGFVYQVWLIDGNTPVSMGLFNPQGNRFATVGNPADYDLLAITVEEGPVGNDQPTSDPLIVADLEPLRGD